MINPEQVSECHFLMGKLIYDFDNFVVLGSVVCLEESALRRLVRSLCYRPSTGRVEIRAHVVRVGECGGGRSNFCTHIGNRSEAGAGL